MTAFVRSFARLFDFVRSISLDIVRFVTGGNVLLPHFYRRVLYRRLYSLRKSVNVMSDITTFIFANC